jgi:imidazolonepropionase-like amidohydrolase
MSVSTKLLALIVLLIANGVGAQTTAITGATVHTVGPAGTLTNATIIFDRGRITAVGVDIAIPANANRVDATGKIVTPGLFSPLGQLGLSEVSAVAGTNDAMQRGDAFTASFNVAEAFNPRSILIAISRIDGVTRAGITPRAGSPDGEGNVSHVLSGLGSIVHLGDSPEHLVKRAAVVVANFGETGSGVAGGSRARAIQILRAALDDARDYARNRAAVERGDWRDYSVSITDLKALQAVLAGNVPLLFNVDRASDISVVLNIAEEYNIRAIVAGGSEAWMVADQLAAAAVPVILNGINNLPGNFDRINARLDSADILVEAGVKVAFGANAQTHNARLLTQTAGISVAYGLTWDQALEAITLAPAEIYGVEASVGSIEPGKDADFVIWTGDPLELTSYPEQVYIQGTAVSMASRQTLLRDRYLRTDRDKPPAFRN